MSVSKEVIIDLMIDGYALINLEGLVLDVNRAYCQMSGFERQEIIGEHISKFQADYSEAETIVRIQAILKYGSGRFESKNIKKNGDIFYCDVSVTKIVQNGAAILVNIIRDITDKKKKNADIVYAHRLSELVSTVSTTFIRTNTTSYDCDIDGMLAEIGKFFHADRSYLLMFSEDYNMLSNTHEWCAAGVRAELENLQNIPSNALPWLKQQILAQDYIHIPDVDILPDAALEERIEFNRQKIKSIIIVPVRSADKTWGFIGLDAVNEYYTWSESEITALRTIANLTGDINYKLYKEQELIRSKEMLEQANSRLEIVLDNLDAYIYVSDMQTYEVLYINELMRKSFGDVVGKTCWHSVQSNQSQPCSFCTNQQLLDSQGEPVGVVVWEVLNTNNNRWFDCRDMALKWHDGRIVRMEIATDITDRKAIDLEKEKVTKEVLLAKQAAEAANQAKSDFLAKVSHEIRTPMNIIIGMSDLIYNSELDEKQKEFMQMIKDSAAGLLTVINDILDFSKIEAGKMEITHEKFNLRKEITSIIDAFSHQASQQGVKLSIDIEETVHNYYIGDPARIRQVLINLLSNAFKFTELGEVKLVVKQKNLDGQLVFEITDTGIGIASDKQELLFESFSQIDNTLARKYEGTGLGLVISKKLVELMGGSIWFTSELGKGSTFSFDIMLELPTEQQEHILDRKEKIDCNEKQVNFKILLAEDKNMNQKLMKILLNKKGWQVTIASNGQEAVELYKAQQFDLILMDILMPIMDGIEATKQIRCHERLMERHTPIIALTANAMGGDREKYLAAGMDDYISKPIDKRKLYKVIEDIVHSKVSQRGE